MTVSPLWKTPIAQLATPTHDAYLEYGTMLGLTFGIFTISYDRTNVNILLQWKFKYAFNDS